MTVVAAILWIWLAISIGVYGYRIYRKVTKGPRPQSAEQDATTTADPDRPVGPATALIQNPIAGFGEAAASTPAPPGDPISPSGPPTGEAAPLPPASIDPQANATVDEPVEAPVDAPPIPVEFAPPLPNPPDPHHQPEWASPTPGAPGAMPTAERRAPRQPVGEAVAGIKLPCDLGPLVGDTSQIDPYDVAFFTTTHDADSVRGALAGELVGLGFQVATTSTYRLAASRTDAEVVVTIYPDPVNAKEGGRPLYPTAHADAVVVRFQS